MRRTSLLIAVAWTRTAAADPAQDQITRLDQAAANAPDGSQALIVGGVAGTAGAGARLQLDLLGTARWRLGLGGTVSTGGEAGEVYVAALGTVGALHGRLQLGLGITRTTPAMITTVEPCLQLGALAAFDLTRHTALVVGPLLAVEPASTSVVLFGGLELH